MKRQSMILRKILSMVTAVCLALTLGTAVSAQTTESEGLQDAILAAKKIFTVPKEYKDFTYSMSTANDIGVKTKIWNLNWASKDQGHSISASMDAQGNLVSFHQFDKKEEWNDQQLAAVSWEEGKKNASDFLQKAMPSADVYSHMRLEPQTYASSVMSNHVYQYRYYANDIPANFLTATIQVDKMTGKITEYDGFLAGSTIPAFPVPEGLIGQESARSAYVDKVGVTLGYFSNFDEETKKLTIFPAYQPEGDTYTVIDAKTGERKIAKYREHGYNTSFGVGMYDLSAGENGDAKAPAPLTKEEREAIIKVAGLLSEQQAEKAVRESLPGMDPKVKLVSSKLDHWVMDGDYYFWTLNFEKNYTGSVDAKTGEFLSFHRPWPDSNGRNIDKKISRQDAQKYADEFLKKVLPAKASQVKYVSKNQYESTEPQYSHEFWYTRQANGMNYYGNNLLLTVTWEGAVVNLSTIWYNNAQFPVVTNAMSREQAFDYLNQKNGMVLTYEYEGPGKVMLAYGMQYDAYDFLVDPYTGAALDIYGAPYHKETLPSYTDLAGHWSESTVKTLLENGYYLEGNYFQPDQIITQGRFFHYLYTFQFQNDTDEEMGEELIRQGIVKKGEWNPSQPLTREDAARYFVRHLGLEKAAQIISGIYDPLFQDTVSEGYQGYASLCIGLNILPTQDGKFYGSSTMTNATAALAIYQLYKLS